MFKSEASKDTIAHHHGEKTNMREEEGEEAPDCNQTLREVGGV